MFVLTCYITLFSQTTHIVASSKFNDVKMKLIEVGN
jgi:hypothetical protein